MLSLKLVFFIEYNNRACRDMINPEKTISKIASEVLTYPDILSDIVVEIEFSVVFFVKSY